MNAICCIVVQGKGHKQHLSFKMRMQSLNFLLRLDILVRLINGMYQFSIICPSNNVSQKDTKSMTDDCQWGTLDVRHSQEPHTDKHLDVRLPGSSGLGNQTSATVLGHGDTRRNATHIRGAV